MYFRESVGTNFGGKISILYVPESIFPINNVVYIGDTIFQNLSSHDKKSESHTRFGIPPRGFNTFFFRSQS